MIGRSSASGGDSGPSPRSVRRDDCGTSTLLALVAALVVLTTVLTGVLVLVEDGFQDAQRDDGERAVAIAASERLVGADGPVASRPNVVERDALESLNESDFREIGAGDGYAMTVAVDGDEVAAIGDFDRGTTIRRVVSIEDHERVERSPRVATLDGHEVTVPVRTDSVDVTIEPSTTGNVTAVRINDRVVLHDEDGLTGTFDLDVSRYETVTLTFAVEGNLAEGDVTVGYRTTTRERAILEVTVAERPGGGMP